MYIHINITLQGNINPCKYSAIKYLFSIFLSFINWDAYSLNYVKYHIRDYMKFEDTVLEHNYNTTPFLYYTIEIIRYIHFIEMLGFYIENA